MIKSLAMVVVGDGGERLTVVEITNDVKLFRRLDSFDCCVD